MEPAGATWLAVAAIVVVGIAAYANALDGPFVFDDRSAIEENQTLRATGDLQAVLRPPRETPVSGRPLVNLTFAANFALGGLDVEGYHLANITLHLLTALVLFGVLRRTFERTPMGPAAPPAFNTLALAVTLLWMVHPLQTECVDYVSQRTEVMAGLLVLLALYASIRSLDHRRRWVLLCAASAVLAAASKESAIVLPLVVVLWDRCFVFDTLGEAWRRRWPTYAAVSLSWVVFASLAGAASATRSVRLADDPSRWTYLLNQANIIPLYLLRSIWPRNLVFDYGAMTPISITEALPGLVLLLVLLAISLALLMRRPPLGFWSAWFWITLAPASSVVPIVTEVGAERRMYLPLIGVACLFTLGAARLLSTLQRRVVAARVGWAVSLIAIAALAFGTISRNREYRSGLTLWQTVIDRRPTPRAYEHLSVYLRDAGRTDDAIALLRVIADRDATAQHALAAALLERGELEEAIRRLRDVIARNPTDPDIGLAHRELASALRRTGDETSAIEQLRLAVARRPDELRNYIELGDALQGSGHVTEAIDVYRRALAIAPRNTVAMSNLGILLAASGAAGEAMAQLRASLAIDPRQVAARIQLVQLLLVAGDFSQAETDARMLVDAAPADAVAWNLLGVALASQQRFEPARGAFAKAVALNPTLTEARQNLARLEAKPRATVHR